MKRRDGKKKTRTKYGLKAKRRRTGGMVDEQHMN